MLKLASIFLSLAISSNCYAETIVDVIARSEMTQIKNLTIVESPKIQTAFKRLSSKALLYVVSQPNVYFSVEGAIYVSKDLEDFSEYYRLFVLAHELGHVDKHHPDQKRNIFKALYPGEVTEQKSGEFNSVQHRELLIFSIDSEFAADAEAFNKLISLGFNKDELLSALMAEMPRYGDTPSHPSSFKRLIRLRGM